MEHLPNVFGWNATFFRTKTGKKWLSNPLGVG